MRTRTFFRAAVVLPLFVLLALWCWEPRLWQHGGEAAANPFTMQVLQFLESWLLEGGGQYMLSAGAVLTAMERMRHRNQIQLLFALSPAIFFLVCCVSALLGSWLAPLLGNNETSYSGVFFALATLTLGTLYVFIMSVTFLVLHRQQLVCDPVALDRKLAGDQRQPVTG